MEFNKKVTVQFGQFSKQPKDTEVKDFLFPDDTIFFTGGEGDIGSSKHKGAFHILGMTKADDVELDAFTKFSKLQTVDMVKNGKYIPFRINGYAFIELCDCLPNSGIEFTDTDTINELLDLKNHPVYVVLLNDECMLCSVTRIDRIESYYMVDCISALLYTQIESKYNPTLYAKTRCGLQDIIHPFYKFSAHFPDETYGKELFDEVVYTCMSRVYPEYKDKLKGFDFEYFHRSRTEACEILKKLNPWLSDFRLMEVQIYPTMEDIKFPLKNE